MNIYIRRNGKLDYKTMRKIEIEQAFDDLKQNLKNKIIEKLTRIDEAFLW